MIDWRKLLDTHRIEYVEKSQHNIYVQCPFCGAADEGYHMGISTRDRGWGCWRSDLHRGRSPARLLMALINVSMAEAFSILNLDREITGDHSLKGRLEEMLNVQTSERTERKEHYLSFPPELKRFKGRAASKMFNQYLIDRGYEKQNLKWLGLDYGLRFSTTGRWKYRLVFPVYTDLGLTTWTGRSIVDGIEPRYLTLTYDEEKAKDEEYVAKANIKECLFNEKEISEKKGQALVLCEGPFDAMRVDYVGNLKHKVRATCLFGKSVSDIQMEKLEIIGARYKRRIVLLDPDAQLDEFRMWSKIKELGFEMKQIPRKYDDPADMPAAAMENFLEEVL